MYFLIEKSPSGFNVVSSFDTLKKAENKAIELENGICNYYITYLVA